MYIKYEEFSGTLNENEILLMSLEEFESGGKDLRGISIAVTPDGEEPIELETEEWKNEESETE